MHKIDKRKQNATLAKLEASRQRIPPPRHVLPFRHLANQYQPMSVNNFPQLPIVTNPGKQSLYPDGDPNRRQNLIIILFTGPLPTYPENFMQIRPKFLRKVANRQTPTYPRWRR